MTRPDARGSLPDEKPPVANAQIKVLCSYVTGGEACARPVKLRANDGKPYHVGGEPLDGHTAQPAQAK